VNSAKITPVTIEERKIRKRMVWKGIGGYAEGFTDGERMAGDGDVMYVKMRERNLVKCF
jgi:hypothetical protein